MRTGSRGVEAIFALLHVGVFRMLSELAASRVNRLGMGIYRCWCWVHRQ